MRGVHDHVPEFISQKLSLGSDHVFWHHHPDVHMPTDVHGGHWTGDRAVAKVFPLFRAVRERGPGLVSWPVSGLERVLAPVSGYRQ